MQWNQSDPFINQNLISKLNDFQEFDPSLSTDVMENMHHSELARIFENADERDLLTVCYVAVRKDPVKYLTVLMDYLLTKEEK